MSRRRLVVSAVVAIGGLAGCGSAQPAKTVTREVVTISGTQPHTNTAPPRTENTSCVIGPRGSDVRVAFAGRYATSYCALALHRWSNENELWEQAASLVETEPAAHPVEVCNLVKGTISAAVETLEGPIRTNRRLSAEGWSI
jgi:hypothetical protein